MAHADPTDPAAQLRELAAAVEDYPVCSAEAGALAAFVGDRLRTLLASLPTRQKVHCAGCRRDVATELRLQTWMN